MTRKTKNIMMCSVLAAILFVFVMMSFSAPGITLAAPDINTSVLQDLSKDATFNVNSFPEDVNDHSVTVIQIAESADNRLFVYTYQPGESPRASSINLSTTANDYLSFTNYPLDYVNSYKTLYKYEVRNFSVLDEDVRYYAISSILRPFDERFDEAPENGNEVSEIAYEVGKQYNFRTEDGEYKCLSVELETITITDKFVGYVRYDEGYKLFNGAIDSHFVAFSTDKDIEKLVEADVYFETYRYTHTLQDGDSFGAVTSQYAYLTDTQHFFHDGAAWLHHPDINFDRIQSIDSFLSEFDGVPQNIYHGLFVDSYRVERITEESLPLLSNKQWVLRFFESDFTFYAYPTGFSEVSTRVNDVMILRLMFENEGKVYNLGVIDNKQSGGDRPVNEEEIYVEPGGLVGDVLNKLKDVANWLKENGKKIGIAIGVILLLIVVLIVVIKVSRSVSIAKTKSDVRKMKKNQDKGKNKKI